MRQDFTIPTNLAAPWAIARCVRRTAPWNVDHIRLPLDTFYRSVRTGVGVDLYILDTGIRSDHVEFTGRANVIGNGEDDHGHGTSVAGLAAGTTTGIAKGATIWGVECLSSSQDTPNAFIENAVDEVLANHAGRDNPAVVNMSLGDQSVDPISENVARLIDAGIVCVATANNFKQELGVEVNRYPGMTADVVCVGGIGMADIPYFNTVNGTNYGAPVDILAPGQTLWTADWDADDAYTLFSGTSGAAPLVAGIVACMLEGHAKLTDRTDVQAVVAKLLANATTGKFRSAFGLSPLPDRIAYLDPDLEIEEF